MLKPIDVLSTHFLFFTHAALGSVDFAEVWVFLKALYSLSHPSPTVLFHRALPKYLVKCRVLHTVPVQAALHAIVKFDQ